MGSQTRKVLEIITPNAVIEGAGVRLKRSLGTPAFNYFDPFLLFDHFGSENPEDYLAGFPMHPHRGIETVTYMMDGAVSHRDTLGNSGTIGAGDVQWMTSGGGIMHEEMPQPIDGRMEGFQLWVNLPARLKMSRPRYQEIPASSIPEVRHDNGTVVRLIAGRLRGIKGPVTEIAADPVYMDIELPPETTFEHAITRGHNVLVYVLKGEGLMGIAAKEDGRVVTPFSLVVLGDGDLVRIRSGESGFRFLLISGKPLGEAIARHGPFVMNSEAEIRQALDDLRNGSFVWKEPA